MKTTLLLFCLMFSTILSKAQLYINEFMAANLTTIADENGEFDDWIEIYNPGSIAVNLAGYYLTDDFANPLKFQLSSSLSVNAEGYLLIFADDDEGQGDNHTNFKLSVDGEAIAIFQLTADDTLLVDSLTFQAQSNNISYGRYPDGSSNLNFFTEPSPGSANIDGDLEGMAESPVFSIPGGFYSGSQSIILSSSTEGAVIRYTTDGSEPTTTSAIYTSAITSDTTFVLKAIVSAPDYLDSRASAQTYFINEHFMSFAMDERLPVISVSCNNEHLYGSAGILTNFELDMERMANIELYEADGSNSINQYAGIKVYGNASRQMEQKSLAVFARSAYGKGSFDYKFFDDKSFDKWESFVMRNGGSDWSLTYFRDALCQALVRNNMYIDAQGSKHAIAYLNGKFYGIIDIKEKINEHYVSMNRGGDPNNIDMLSDDQTVIYGDAQKYNEYRNFMVGNDMSDPSFYKELNKMMDIPNFMNNQITHIYLANIDFFLNSKFWREKENYGKWRWILYDTELSTAQGDYSYTTSYGTTADINTLWFASSADGGPGWPFLRPWSSNKFRSILNNQNFRNEFIQSFAVHLNTTFKTDRVLGLIDSMQNRVRNEIPMQIATYSGHDVVFNPYGIHFSEISEWEYYCDLMRGFAVERPAYIRSFIQEDFQLSGTYTLRVTMDNHAAGIVTIQDIKVPVDSSGIYFNDVPLRLSAIPANGYRFVRWLGVDGVDSSSSNLTLTLSQNTIVEAVFEPEGEVLITEILYQSLGDKITEFIEIYNPKQTTSIDLSNYIVSGDVNLTIPFGTIIEPNGFLIIASDTSNLYMSNSVPSYEWTSGDLLNTNGVIVLKNDFGLTIDSVSYINSSPWPSVDINMSIELKDMSLDNNQGQNWQASNFIAGTPAVPTLSSGVASLVINEFVANNGDFFADEWNEFNDWIEILNNSSEPVDLAGMYITNNLSNPVKYQIPLGYSEQTVIQPYGHKIIWADADLDQGPLHANFKLDADRGAIGISADGRSFIDTTIYLDQLSDVSLGRYADGETEWRSFNTPTPGEVNNYAPRFTSVPVLNCYTGQLYEYTITWEEEDADELIWGRITMPYWLTITQLSSNSALLSGIPPVGTIKNYPVGYFIFDGYTSPVSQQFTLLKDNATEIQPENFTQKFKCYPNPSEGIFNIEILSASASVQILISSIDGKTMISREVESDGKGVNYMLDLTDYNDGVYFIYLKTDEGTYTQKVLKQ